MTDQRSEGEFKKAERLSPPSVPLMESAGKALPPALPPREREVLRGIEYVEEKNSFWKVAALAGLLIVALLAVAALYWIGNRPLIVASRDANQSSEDLTTPESALAKGAAEKAAAETAAAKTAAAETAAAEKAAAETAAAKTAAAEKAAAETAAAKTAAAEKAAAKKAAAETAAVSGTCFDDLKNYIDLGEPRGPVSGLDTGSYPLALGTLKHWDLPLEVELLGVPFKGDNPVVSIRSLKDLEDKRRWAIVGSASDKPEEEAIGDIWIKKETTDGGDIGGKVFVQWRENVRRQQRDAKLVRQGILGLYAPTAAEPKCQKFISFTEPTKVEKPLSFGTKLLNDGLVKRRLTGATVPKAQQAVMYCRVDGLPSADIKNLSQIVEGSSHSIPFDKDFPMRVILVLELELDDDRNPRITLRISIPSYEKHAKSKIGLAWLNKRVRVREDLENKLENIVVRHLAHFARKTEADAREHYRKEKEKGESAHRKIISDLQHGDASRLFEDLIRHEKNFQDLYECEEDLLSIGDGIRLHLKVMRRPANHAPKEKKIPEVLLYYNDESLLTE